MAARMVGEDDTNDDAPVSGEEALQRKMSAVQLRDWCSRNGVNRSRGDSKSMTAEKAVEQKPHAVLEELGGSRHGMFTFAAPDDEHAFLRSEAEARAADGWVVLHRGYNPYEGGEEYIHVAFF